MNDGHPAVGIGIFLIFILVNAILYGFGAAIQAVNENTIEEKAKEGDKKSRKLLKWMDNPVRLINSIHMATIIMNMIVGAYLVTMISTVIENAANIDSHEWINWIVAMVLVIMLTVLGIFVPKKLATKNAQHFVYSAYGFVSVMLIVVLPITYVITKISNGAIRLCGISPYGDDDNVTEEEIITMVNEGHEQGVILASEAEMITNIFEFGDKEAQDIMTHRKNIIALDGNLTINDALDTIVKESNSRFPVYDKDIDNIIGILHFRDLIKIYADVSMRNHTLNDLKDEMLFEAHFIPETRNINALFKSMQTEKAHMTIVVDEYGQTAGVVTMEDILEEIVGNIMDEHDTEEQLILVEGKDSYIMDGAAMLDDIEDLLDIEFEDEDFDTLNGFMTSCLGKLPESGEEFEVEYNGYMFKILEVENRMIKKVDVRKAEGEVA